MAKLFDMGPLFQGDEQASQEQLTTINPTAVAQQQNPFAMQLFSALKQEAQQDPNVAMEIQNQFNKINEEKERDIEAIRGMGMLARYPTILSDEDAAREKARLMRHGLNEKQADKRIEKWRQKGGKVKTSSYLMAAATLLSGGINGYLAAKNRTGYNPAAGGLMKLASDARARLDQQVAMVEQAAEEKKALILSQDKREFEKYLAEVKADADSWSVLKRKALELGVPFEGKAPEELAEDLVYEQARRQEHREAMAQVRVQTSEERLALSRDEAYRERLKDVQKAADDKVTEAIKQDRLDTVSDNTLLLAYGYEWNPKTKEFDLGSPISGKEVVQRIRESLEEQAKEIKLKEEIKLRGDISDLKFKETRQTDEEKAKAKADREAQAELNQLASLMTYVRSQPNWEEDKGLKAGADKLVTDAIIQVQRLNPDMSAADAERVFNMMVQSLMQRGGPAPGQFTPQHRPE